MTSELRRAIGLAWPLFAVAGCAGDDVAAEGDAQTTGAVTSSSGDGAGPTAGTSSDGTPSPDSSTTGVADADTGPQSTGTSAADSDGSDSGGSSGSSGGSSTGSDDNAVYTAVAIPGGLDRIRVHKANLDDDLCTWMVLVAPAMPAMFPAVTTPMGWSVESAAINDSADSCEAQTPAMFGADAATDAEGAVAFGRNGAGGVYPCTLDVDVTLQFAPMLPGVPSSATMSAIEIDVSGC